MATSTANFGAGKRESHDSSTYYARRMTQTPMGGVVGEVSDAPATVLDRVFVQSSESMDQLPDNCVALVVTSPPYNVGKDYDEDLALEHGGLGRPAVHRTDTTPPARLSGRGRPAGPGPDGRDHPGSEQR